MSGFADYLPLQEGETPEEYIRSQQRGLTVPLSHLYTGLLSRVMLPGQDVAPGPIEQYLPGVVTRIGGGLLSGVDAAQRIIDQLTLQPSQFIRGQLGLPDRGYTVPPTPQFITRLAELGQSSRDRAEQILPSVQPENESEDVLADIGDQLGLMYSPLHLASRILPKVAQYGLNLAAPLTGPHKLATGATATGLLLAQEAAADAEAAPTQPQAEQPLPVPPIPPANPPPEQPKQSFTFGDVTQPQFGWSTEPVREPDMVTPQTGYSPLTAAEAIAGGAMLLSPFAAFKYARRLPRAMRLGGAPDMAPGSEYAQRADAFKDYMFGSNPPTGGEIPQAPLAIKPSDMAWLQLQQGIQDDTALLRAHFTNSDASNIDLAHEIGDVKNHAAQQARVTSFMETGKHEASGVRTVPPQEVMLKEGRLTPDQKQVIDDALWAGTEMNYRLDAYTKAVNAGEPFNVADLRRSMRTTDDATLHARIAAGQADPQTAEVINGIHQIGLGNMDIADKLGYPTDVINKIRRTQSDYIPTPGPDQTPIHVFDERSTDPGSGFITPTTRAIDIFMQHQDSILKRFENDVLNRKMIDGDAYAARANPDYQRLFTRNTQPNGEPVVSQPLDNITIPRRGGFETYLIGNKEIAAAMHASPTMKRAIMQASRGWFTRMTTGSGALAAAGKFFPAVHGMTRGPYLQLLNTPPVAYNSLADLAYKKTGLPGSFRLSPDVFAGSPAMATRYLYGRAGHAMSNMLMQGARNPANMVLRSVIGDAATDAVRQRMVSNYEKSFAYRYRASGVAHSGNYAGMEAPSYEIGNTGFLSRQLGLKPKIVSNPAATLAPRSVTPVSWLGKKMPFSTNLNNLVHEVFTAFMEGPNMYSYELNRYNPNLSEPQRVNIARGLLGDPGKQGSGPITQAVIRNVPYTNATIQDLSRAAQAKAEMPFSRGIHRAVLLSTAAAASLYSAMNTPGGLAHLINSTSANQLATGPMLYNGTDTDNITQLSLPQSERAIWPFILDIMGILTGAWDAHKDEATFDRAYHTLAALFSHHVMNRTLTDATAGLTQQVDPFMSLPTPFNAAIVGIAGKDPRLQADRVFDQLSRGRPTNPAVDLGNQTRAPNVAGQDSVFGNQEGKKTEHIVSAVIGLGADLLETMNRGYGAWKHGLGPEGISGAMLDNMWQHVKDQNATFNNVLWSNATRVSPASPLVVETDKSIETMRDMARAVNDIIYEGQTRRGGAILTGDADKKIADDPIIRDMAVTTERFYDIISKKWMPQVNDIKALDKELNEMTMDEGLRRQKHNQLMRDLNQAYVPIAENVAILNDRLSAMAGKRVDIGSGDIDWTKGSSQFAK